MERTLAVDCWRSGFLRVPDEKFDWKQWQPVQDTLIIVDYAAVFSKQVGSIIAVLARREASLTRKVPLLLLEREGFSADNWIRDVTGEGREREAAKNLEFRPDPLELKQLSDDEFWSIFTEALGQGNTANRDDLLPQIMDVDARRRPLFALFAAKLS